MIPHSDASVDMMSMITTDEVQAMVDRVLEDGSALTSVETQLPRVQYNTNCEDMHVEILQREHVMNTTDETVTANPITAGIMMTHKNCTNNTEYGLEYPKTEDRQEPAKQKSSDKKTRISRTVYNELPLSQKAKLIHDYESKGCSQRTLAKNYKIATGTVYQIIKQKDKILLDNERLLLNTDDKMSSCKKTNSKVKRGHRKSTMANLNEALQDYVEQSLANKEVLSGPILKAKAKQIASQMALTEFKASNGWLESFKKRCSLDFTASAALTRESQRKKDTSEAFEKMTQELLNKIYGSDSRSSCPQDGSVEATSPRSTAEQLTSKSPCHGLTTSPLIPTSSDDDDVLSPANEAASMANFQPHISWTSFNPVSLDDQQKHETVDLWSLSNGSETASPTDLFQLEVQHTMDSGHSSAVNGSSTAIKQPIVSMNLLAGGQETTITDNTAPLMHANCSLDSRIEVPAISCVREAIDILERFSLTKMPCLLTNVLNIRQEVGNYVIQQQHFQHDQQSHQHPSVHVTANQLLSQQQTTPTSTVHLNLSNLLNWLAFFRTSFIPQEYLSFLSLLPQLEVILFSTHLWETFLLQKMQNSLPESTGHVGQIRSEKRRESLLRT